MEGVATVEVESEPIYWPEMHGERLTLCIHTLLSQIIILIFSLCIIFHGTRRCSQMRTTRRILHFRDLPFPI